MLNSWSGVVSANLEQGQPTGLLIKAGNVISVVARGWVKYALADNASASPEGTMPMYQPVSLYGLKLPIKLTKLGMESYEEEFP
ncbi:LecA/PA-IL family lectin [Xenorhabdus doucetiae]|uniref:PA-IL-like protein n=1 Tax=Xenorhabdus doucetiae TaxID=351671 RepID=A0ABY3NND6_9GAMM|nr:PA-IL-like protein [Xenorhabdus doucetiae]